MRSLRERSCCCQPTIASARTAPFKIGLNEVGIGMALPMFAIELARERLTPTEFGPATLQARIYDPAAAVGVGYLDRVVAADEVFDTALADAQRPGRAP